jgi:4-diphosphocytidyl-2-C-methyl-D-erythritol kinase
VIVFPNCKINLGLHITRKRKDGFHDLETLFYPILLQDALEVISNEATEPLQFTQSGIVIETAGDNICEKAYALLKKDFPQLPSVKMHLHKAIPMGAGLGGGSADGAFTLLLLNKKYNLQLTDGQLIDYALQLGSDCPFFIINKPCLASGRGEKLQEFPLDLTPYKIVIVNPGIHINTGWAFSQLQQAAPSLPLAEVLQKPIQDWRHYLLNDFEGPIFSQYSEIKGIKDTLYNMGAIYASMTGSGSTVYGLFKKNEKLSFSFPAHYFVKEC